MKKLLISCIVLILGAGFLISCLDEDPLFNPAKSENIIEFFDIGEIASPADAIYPLYVSSFTLSPASEFNVIISYSGANGNDRDITVNLELSQIALDQYNADQDQNYEILPESLYTVPGLTVTIPKGQTKANLKFILKTQDFDLEKAYALPLKIVSSSHGTISGNFSTAIFAVGAKNKFDGVFSVTGNMVDALGTFRGFYPTTVELRTVNAVTNNHFDIDLGTPLHGIVRISDGALFVFGNFSIQFEFDNDGNVVAARNTQPPGAGNRTGKLGTGINKMTFKPDGTPDKLEVTYIMTQAGADRATFTETWTYLRER